MVFVNHATRSIHIRVLYRGESERSLRWLAAHVRAGVRGRLDQFADLDEVQVPLSFAPIGGYAIWATATTHGDSGDGLVFVANRSADATALASVAHLDALPRVLQIDGSHDADRALLAGPWSAIVPADAMTGMGVLTALEAAARVPYLAHGTR
ncbi:MAG: hypothetical protein IAG13_09335 [Deltaproteobacteria bacterium]|nr:hypothetical protein [Nannocystaceae bacterium]